MVDQRSMLILYSSATCNLKCRYCYIDKSPILKDIDNALEESFKGDYYFEYTKKVFPDPNQLKEIQIWGGEPFLSLDRIFPVLTKIMNHYPNSNKMMISTNFVSKSFMNQFNGLMNVFSKLNRTIEFTLQLSLDGPVEYTDSGRGKGVTAKFINQFDEFILNLKTHLPANVKLCLAFKPTLDAISIKQLQSIEEVIHYYSIFDECIGKVRGSGLNMQQVFIPPALPNTAAPSPFTRSDGELFANFCKICKTLEDEKYFRYYQRLRPYPKRDQMEYDNPSYSMPGYTCMSGRGMVGLLPNEMISECHMGFIDTLGKLKSDPSRNKNSTLQQGFFDNRLSNQMTHSFSELEFYEKKMSYFHNRGSSARLTTMVNSIRLEAMAGNIKKKFSNEKEAIKAARFVVGTCSFCVRDNLNVVGALVSNPIGIYRLFFNGAEEYLDYE